MPNKFKNKKNKVPNIENVTIFGIFSFAEEQLIYVSLDEEDVWFEFDFNMYDEDNYTVVKLPITLKK
jgi:hypothetical protein